MSLFLYFNENLKPDKEQEAINLLKSQGYTEHTACEGSYLHEERCIISLGFDRKLIQYNINEIDLTKYLKDVQRTIDELRRICNITHYQTDFDAPVPEELNLEGLLKKE